MTTESESIKLAFVINSLGTGGAERSLCELLPPLRAAGVEATVFCLKRSNEGAEQMVVGAGFPVHHLDGSSIAQWVVALRRHLRWTDPHIVHTSLFEADVVGRLAAIGLKAKVMTSLVNISYDSDRLADPRLSRVKLRTVQTIDAITARFLCDHFHAITEAVASAAVSQLRIPRDRVTVVVRGRDPARLGQASPRRREAARAGLGVAQDAPVLVAVGRQEYQKGHAGLLEAMALLQGSRSPLLLLAGREGHESARLQELVRRHGLQDRVRFLGHRGDVPEILAAADVFVFPSLYEGLGGALIEAMALGLPIVTSDIPAVAEVVERGCNAILVRPGDVNELATAMRVLLEDDLMRQRYGRRSRDIFEAKFRLDEVADETVAMYRRILDGSGR